MDENRIEIQQPNGLPPENEGSEDGNEAQDLTSKSERSSITELARQKAGADNENQSKKLRFPKAIFFIVGSVLCEGLNYYGTWEILLKYFEETFQYSTETVYTILVALDLCGGLFCFVGAIISDSWLGKFKTILYVSIVNIFGSVLTALGAIPYFREAAALHMFVGLTLIALSSDIIKVCVAAFGGDQFKLPEQANPLAWFFILFYLNDFLGYFIANLLNPIIRDEVHCFGEHNCQSLAFGVPGFLMILSFVLFLVGRPFYNIIEPSGNIFKLGIETIYNAISTRCKERKTNPRPHWLDYADQKHDEQTIADIKAFWRILILFLPLPFACCFIYAMRKNWYYQASHMDCDMGSFVLSERDLHIFELLLAVIFLPLSRLLIYPALKFIGIHTQLQKMVFGGILASVAFIISLVLEVFLRKTYPLLPETGKSQLRIFNGEPCEYVFTTNIPGRESFDMGAFDYFEDKDIAVENGTFQFEYQIEVKSDAPECARFRPDSHSMDENQAHSMFMASNSPYHKLIWFKDDVSRPGGKYNSLTRTLTNVESVGKVIWRNAQTGHIEHAEEFFVNHQTDLPYGAYKIFINADEIYEIYLQIGGVYTVIISENLENGGGRYIVKSYEITKPYSVPVAWVVPQFVVLELAEIIFFVTALEFSYSQAPFSMKAIVMACVIWTRTLGTVIVHWFWLKLDYTFISKVTEYILFSCLMIVDMLIFMLLAHFYTPNDPNGSENNQRESNG